MPQLPRKVLLALSVLSPLVLGATPGEAGTISDPGFFTCSKAPDGSGSCSGNYGAFRAAPEQTAYAFFLTRADGTGQFAAQDGNNFYTCLRPSSGKVASLWPYTLNATVFTVSWGTNGVCKSLELEKDSTISQ
jgi:hypothetical protein